MGKRKPREAASVAPSPRELTVALECLLYFPRPQASSPPRLLESLCTHGLLSLLWALAFLVPPTGMPFPEQEIPNYPHNPVPCHPALLPLSRVSCSFRTCCPFVLKCFPIWLSVLGTMCSLTPDQALEAEEPSLLPSGGSSGHPAPLLQGCVRLPGHCPPEQFPVKSHD